MVMVNTGLYANIFMCLIYAEMRAHTYKESTLTANAMECYVTFLYMCIIDTLSHFLVGYLQNVLHIRAAMSNCFYHKRKSTDLQASLASMHCSASTDRMIPVCWH